MADLSSGVFELALLRFGWVGNSQFGWLIDQEFTPG